MSFLRCSSNPNTFSYYSKGSTGANWLTVIKDHLWISVWVTAEIANKIHPTLSTHRSNWWSCMAVTLLAAHPWKPGFTILQGLLLHSSSYLYILGSNTSPGKGACANWYSQNCCLFQPQGPGVFQLFLSVQTWSLCSKGFSSRDTQKPSQVSIVTKLYSYRFQNATVKCECPNILLPTRCTWHLWAPTSLCWRADPRSTAFTLQCFFGGWGLGCL